MSRTILLGTGIPLVDAVASRLPAGTADLRNNLVLFPGKRPAHFLRKALAERIGTAYLPPRIASVDTFIDGLYESVLGRLDGNIDDVDAVAILYDIHTKSPQRIGGDHFMAIDDFLPLGLRIFSEIEELKMACLSPHRIAELDGLALPFSNLQPLSRFYNEFYNALGDIRHSTRASRYAAVAEELPAGAFDRYDQVIVAGFFAFTVAEQKLFRRIASLPNATFLFQDGPGIEATINTLGLKFELETATAPRTEFDFISAPDVHGEIFAVTAEMEKLQKEGAVDEKTVIVLPDAESLFPLLHESLSLLGPDEYNISLGYPLERTPAFAFLNSIMDAVTSMHNDLLHAPDYFKLVLHPYTKNIRYGRSAEVTRILFHAIETAFAGQPSRSYFRLTDVEEAPLIDGLSERLEGVTDLPTQAEPEALRQHLRSIHNHLLRPFQEIASVGDFCAKCIAVLEYINGESTANRHVYFQPFVATLADLLEKLSLSLLGPKTFREPANYVHFIRRCMAGSRVPFEGTPLHGVQVLGFLETRGLSFDRVLFLDANDDLFPGARGTDMLLPQQIREQLGLETYRDRERLTAYYFHQLVRNAREVTFHGISARGKEKSRFVEKILWERQQADATYEARPYIKTVKYNVSLSNRYPEPRVKTPAVTDRLQHFIFSASLLDSYLGCGLRFYYAYLAGLDEREDVSAGPDQTDIGILVHAVLAEYFGQFRRRELKAEMFDRAEVEEVVNRQFTKRFGDEPAGMKFLLRAQIKEHVWKVIEDYQLPILERNRVIIASLEQKFGAKLDGREFRGYADRIEMRDDTYFILDYKTGANDAFYRVDTDAISLDDRSTWENAIGSLQLPLYALMYSEANGLPITRIEPAYLMIGRNVISEDCEVRLFEEGQGTEERYAILRGVINRLVAEIVDPERPFQPTSDPERNCPRCPYKSLCGTEWIRGR